MAATESRETIRDGDKEYTQVADHDYHRKLLYENEGWQIGNVEKAARFDSPTGVQRVTVTKFRDCEVAINCYEPGAHDEMHCHNEDQTFIILEGECTMKFPDGGESVLKPGMMATITGGSFYQLNNLTDAPLVMIGNRSGSQNTTLKIDYETRKPLNEGGFRDLEVKDTTPDVAALATTP